MGGLEAAGGKVGVASARGMFLRPMSKDLVKSARYGEEVGGAAEKASGPRSFRARGKVRERCEHARPRADAVDRAADPRGTGADPRMILSLLTEVLARVVTDAVTHAAAALLQKPAPRAAAPAVIASGGAMATRFAEYVGCGARARGHREARGPISPASGGGGRPSSSAGDAALAALDRALATIDPPADGASPYRR
jgi:hypothetical protein